MRIFSFLIAILILSGCAHNRIRLVKSDKHQVVINKNSNDEEHSNNAQENEVAFVKTAPEKSDVTPTLTPSQKHLIDDPEESSHTKTHFERTFEPADTIRIDSDEYKVLVAEEAEENALKARNMFIITLGMMILPFVSIFALIPFIIGSIRLSRAKNSQYITPFGQNQQRIATILQWVYAGILILGLIIAILIIAIFFL